MHLIYSFCADIFLECSVDANQNQSRLSPVASRAANTPLWDFMFTFDAGHLGHLSFPHLPTNVFKPTANGGRKGSWMTIDNTTDSHEVVSFFPIYPGVMQLPILTCVDVMLACNLFPGEKILGFFATACVRFDWCAAGHIQTFAFYQKVYAGAPITFIQPLQVLPISFRNHRHNSHSKHAQHHYINEVHRPDILFDVHNHYHSTRIQHQHQTLPSRATRMFCRQCRNKE